MMFIFPPLTYALHFRRQNQISKLMIFLCILMIVFGVAALIITTTFSVIAIVEAFESSGKPDIVCNVTAF